ncbi:Transcription initiation factor TFIID subunit 12 [Vermiconidia calcicola]|uniref:Transcription initiation factor TFIID subunit 12 n=1 Tax=Vermiconidia calcicola TaxID=1690605 RepID=A0ACC3N688_9PEZI|nr:Transcription initiation factor TFIID subunit 12 [Vermiconidia calcicola]
MAQPQNQGQQSAPPLIRAHQIDALPLFTAEQKQHYKRGLTELWNVLDNSPQGSPAYLQAEEKIRNASMKIMQQISKGGNNRPTSGGGPPRPGQQGAGQGGMPQSVGMAQQGSQQGGQPQPQQVQQQQQPQMSNATKQELSNVKINIPPHVVQQGQQAQIAYRQQWYRKGGQLLTRKELAKQRGVSLQQQRSAGQGNAQQIDAEMEKCRSEMYAAHAEWEGMKTKNSSMDPMQNMQRQHSGQGQNPQQQVSGGQQQQHHQQQNQAAMQGMHNAQQQGDVKMQDTRGTSHSPQQPQGGFQQQQQAPTSQNQVAPSPAQQQQNMTQPPNSAHSQQTPHSATQQGFPQQNNMQQQQPNQQRPPMTGHQMSQAHQNMAQAQQQQQQQLNTPTSGVPQSATQQHPPQQAQQAQQQQQQPQQQRPQPLSHQAAISRAAEDYSRQQQQQPNQQQPPQQNTQMPQVPNGLPLVPPSSATQQTPNSAYPALQQQSQSASASTKFPIPKQLNLDPRTQVPVQGPASRPTFSNAGMMSQPGLQRPAQFTLEGEGDRVLSKRKLDELVRQVTGTASSSSTDQGVLSADVEEAVLTLADDFVDNVITAACRLAKLRSSQTLDVRDIQIVLERNYGIRIPGYGLDEPAAGWQTKMQAVQAGKVMGEVGKDA